MQDHQLVVARTVAHRQPRQRNIAQPQPVAAAGNSQIAGQRTTPQVEHVVAAGQGHGTGQRSGGQRDLIAGANDVQPVDHPAVVEYPAAVHGHVLCQPAGRNGLAPAGQHGGIARFAPGQDKLAALRDLVVHGQATRRHGLAAAIQHVVAGNTARLHKLPAALDRGRRRLPFHHLVSAACHRRAGHHSAAEHGLQTAADGRVAGYPATGHQLGTARHRGKFGHATGKDELPPAGLDIGCTGKAGYRLVGPGAEGGRAGRTSGQHVLAALGNQGIAGRTAR